MNLVWKSFLESRGAVVQDGIAIGFGSTDTEWQAARSGSVIADLSHLGVLEFSGRDAESFLQGQLSCDVLAVVPGSATVGGYCTPKGRLLADFVLLRASPTAFRMLLARDIAETIRKRLSMYVLRARVDIAERSDQLVRIGVAGPAAAEAGAAPLDLRASAAGAADSAGDMIRLQGNRFVLLADSSAACGIWDALASRMPPVGTGCWEWLDIRSGFPWITMATQDRFVPQMINLDRLGGVSFSKGCYPGQEIVARTRYLGATKRSLFMASVVADPCPVPGDPLFGSDSAGQAIGTVLNVAPMPAGGCDLLVVAHDAVAQASTARLRSSSGPPLVLSAAPVS